ncbi:hypothetical protein FQZ97_1160290 [compost metagenome]
MAEGQQDGLEVPQQQARAQGHGAGQPQAALGEKCGAGCIVGAVADGDQVAHGGDHPDAEDRGEGIAGRAQAAAGQGLGADQAHHHGVGEDHQHMGELRRDQRSGQAKDGHQFIAYALRHE